jgi:hypothetical protein
MKGKKYFRKKSLDGYPWRPLLGILVLSMIFLPGLLSACGALNGSSPKVNGQAPKESRQNDKGSYVPGEVLVKFKEGVDRVKVERLAAKHNCRIEASISTIQLYRMKILDKRDVWDVVLVFDQDPRVEYAEPNFIERPTGAPPGDS